jgi:4-coumarate--CoA ligase
MPIAVGGVVYWMRQFDFLALLGFVDKFECNVLGTVPPIVLRIAKTPEVKAQLKHLKIMWAGAAPMGKELQDEARELLPNCVVNQLWGMSETTGVGCLGSMAQHDTSGSIGQLMPGTRAR